MRWVLLVVSSAQRERATELMMAPASEGGVSVRQKVDGAWQDWAPAPGLDWSLALSELGGLAGIRNEPYPKAGIIYGGLFGRSRQMAHPDDGRKSRMHLTGSRKSDGMSIPAAELRRLPHIHWFLASSRVGLPAGCG